MSLGAQTSRDTHGGFYVKRHQPPVLSVPMIRFHGQFQADPLMYLCRQIQTRPFGMSRTLPPNWFFLSFRLVPASVPGLAGFPCGHARSLSPANVVANVGLLSQRTCCREEHVSLPCASFF